MERAWRAGIVVVVAAGNEGRNDVAGTNGYGTIASPGTHPLVITVGAMRDMGTASRADDRVASYSSKGPTMPDHFLKPDLVAPGNRMITLTSGTGTLWKGSATAGNRILRQYYQDTASGAESPSCYILSGTSMAAPMVAGAAALRSPANRASWQRTWTTRRRCRT